MLLTSASAVMPQSTDTSLDLAATREIKKLYFVLSRLLDEDRFLTEDELRHHSERLMRIFRNGAGIYRMRNLAPDDLKEDFDRLFDGIIEATLEDELYEKTANLTRMRVFFDAGFASQQAAETHAAEPA